MPTYIERLNLKVGDPINWSKVEPDLVADVIDSHGHIVVGTTGNIHAWWGRWVSGNGSDNMRKVLAHHGGSTGWNDIQKPIDQHQEVLKKYLGHEVEVDAVDEVSLRRPQTLTDFMTAARISPQIIEVQGRSAWFGEAHFYLGRVVRGMVFPMNATQMNLRRAQLEKLQPILLRSTNPLVRSAGRNLGEGLATEGSASLHAFRKSDDNLLNALIEINDIVMATFERGAALDRYRNGMEDIIISVHKRVAEAKAAWDSTENEEEREEAVSKLNNPFGIPYLRTIKVQPFKALVEELFAKSHIDQIPDLGYSGISKALTRAEDRLDSMQRNFKVRRQGAV